MNTSTTSASLTATPASAPTAFAPVPAHVPPELVWEHDIHKFAAGFTDPFKGISTLHQGPDIIWARSASRGSPGWVPTRFALIQEIFMDPQRFSSMDNIGVGPMLGVDWRLNPLEIDPPDHMAYRMVLQPWFTPAAVRRMEAMIRGIALELIEKFEHKKGCEFIEDFASLFPSYIFLEMLGLPRSMLPQFFEWEHAFIRSPVMADRIAAARAIKDYLEQYLESRRQDPRDDLVTAILTAQVRGRPLNQGEITGMAMTLYFGGLDTVLSSIGWYFHHLAGDQALQTRLRERPQDIPGAVDDLLRAYGVVATRRTVTADLEFHGVAMKQGDIVLVPGFLASRDERQYSNPDIVDPDRKARHLTLATGPHNCLGAHLARTEMRVVLEEFLRRFTAMRIPAGQQASWVTDGVWAVTSLPLEWD